MRNILGAVWQSSRSKSGLIWKSIDEQQVPLKSIDEQQVFMLRCTAYMWVSGPLARPFHWWGLSCCTAAAYRETYAVLNKSTFYLSSENAKEEKNRRTVARGKLIGAGMAAQAAGVYAVKNSKTCIVMWLEALQSVLYIINISFISYVCVQLHCVVIFAFYL